MIKSLPIATVGPLFVLQRFISRVVGREHIPAHGAFLLAANHSSLLDGPLVMSWMNYQRFSPTHAISHHEPFKHWFWGWILRSTRCISLTRGDEQSGIMVLRQALGYLAMGEAVGIFPEGRLNPGARLRSFRPGLGILAVESGAPILPIGLRGTRQVLPPNGGPFRFRCCVEIHIGPMIETTGAAHAYHNAEQPARQEILAGLLKKTSDAIAQLSGMQPPKARRARRQSTPVNPSAAEPSH